VAKRRSFGIPRAGASFCSAVKLARFPRIQQENLRADSVRLALKPARLPRSGRQYGTSRHRFGHPYLMESNISDRKIWLNIAATGHCCYDMTMLDISEVVTAVDGGNRFASAERELVPQPISRARCLWCGRSFRPRSTGGSAQKFCCTEHRQQF